MRTNRFFKAHIFVALLSGTAIAQPSYAQSAADAADAPSAFDNTEIVVTARKRAESAQDVPATINVLVGQALSRAGIVSSLDIQNVTPSLGISSTGRETNISLRGVTNNVRSIGSDGSTAINLNEIFLPRSSMVLTELYDIERVEILKGPQASLFGRNATGGAINIYTTKPSSEPEAEGFVGFGSNGLLRSHLAASGGGDRFAIRIAAAYAKDDGYTKNLVDGSNLDTTDYKSIRGSVRWQVTDNFAISAFYQNADDRGTLGLALYQDPTYIPAGSYGLLGPTEADPRHVRLDYPVFVTRKTDVAGVTLDLNLGGVTLRSISGYARLGYADSYDTDGTGAPLDYWNSEQRIRSLSQEFQALSSNSGPLKWIFGAYLYKDKGYERYREGAPVPFPVGVPTLYVDSISNAESTSYAAYFQGTYDLSTAFSITASGRYTHDEKSASRTNFGVTGVNTTVTSQKFTPSAQLQWRPDKNVMIYAGVATGYKSGGINTQDTSGGPTFQPESLTAYEAGIKSEFADRRVKLNVTGFYYDYKQIQMRSNINVLQPDGSTRTFSRVTNAAGAKVKGVEVDAEIRLTKSLSIDGNIAYLDAPIYGFVTPGTRVDLSGRQLPLSPKWSGTVGASYQSPKLDIGSINARIHYDFRSSQYFPWTYGVTDANLAFNTQKSYGLLNATIRWTAKSEKYYLELIGRNLGDVLYYNTKASFPPSQLIYNYGSPRTVEARLGFKF